MADESAEAVTLGEGGTTVDTRALQVIVPDPDNERGVRVIDHHTGRVIASGHLVADALAHLGRRVESTDAIDETMLISSQVRFEGYLGMPS